MELYDEGSAALVNIIFVMYSVQRFLLGLSYPSNSNWILDLDLRSISCQNKHIPFWYK